MRSGRRLVLNKKSLRAIENIKILGVEQTKTRGYTESFEKLQEEVSRNGHLIYVIQGLFIFAGKIDE